MVVGPSGYESVLEVHLDTLTVTSSLNDIRLVTAESAWVSRYLFSYDSCSHFLRFLAHYRRLSDGPWSELGPL